MRFGQIAPFVIIAAGNAASRFVPAVKITNLSTLAAKKAITARDITLKPLAMEECMRQVYEYGFMLAELQTVGNISTCLGVAPNSFPPLYRMAKQSIIGKCKSTDNKCIGGSEFEIFDHQRPHRDHFVVTSNWTDTHAANATLCEKQVNERNWEFSFEDSSKAARAFWWHRENDGTHCMALDSVDMIPAAQYTWALAAPPQWDAELVKSVGCSEFVRRYPDFELAFKTGAVKCSKFEIFVSKSTPEN